jgi:hypothetical protein
VVGGVGAAAAFRADDGAAAAACAGALGALQRSLQGSLAAGVNGGVPAIGEAFFPEDKREEPHVTQDDRVALIDALEAFVLTCAVAVETHGRAAREAAALANAELRDARTQGDRKAARSSPLALAAVSIEKTQGMFVRCAAEVRVEVARAVARAEERHGGGEGDGSEKGTL